jgi:hypothetical protein
MGLKLQSPTDDRPTASEPVDSRDGIAFCALCLTWLFLVSLVGIFTFYTPDRLVLAVAGEGLKGAEWLKLAGTAAFLGLIFLFFGASWLTLRLLVERRVVQRG